MGTCPRRGPSRGRASGRGRSTSVGRALLRAETCSSRTEERSEDGARRPARSRRPERVVRALVPVVAAAGRAPSCGRRLQTHDEKSAVSEGANRRAKRGVSAGRTTCPTTGARRPRARKIAQCGAGHGRSHRASSGAHVLPGVLRGVVAAARGALISPPALVGTAPAPRPRSSFNHGMSASYSTPRTPPARAWGSGGAQGRRLRGPGKGHDGPKKRPAAARAGRATGGGRKTGAASSFARGSGCASAPPRATQTPS